MVQGQKDKKGKRVSSPLRLLADSEFWRMEADRLPRSVAEGHDFSGRSREASPCRGVPRGKGEGRGTKAQSSWRAAALRGA